MNTRHMAELHLNFPYGKGMWIWYLSQCEGGNLQAIINKCKEYEISYVIVKCGDGRNTWAQFTPQMVATFKNAGIKIYSWNYVYGQDPLREAAIAKWALDMGVDGHVFDAEGEYERISNPAQTAITMLEDVRRHAPNAFLAHAPFPIISYHRSFPYAEFGKYCDAVMPQLYWGTLGRSPVETIQWTYQEWSKWETAMKNSGRGESVKPIIPIGQTYDNPQTNYVCNPGDIKAFMDGVFGYMSVNFWDWQHCLRSDLWQTIKDVDMKPKPQSVQASESVPTPTPEPVTPIVEFPPVNVTVLPDPVIPTVTTTSTETVINETTTTATVPLDVPPVVAATVDPVTVIKDDQHTPDEVNLNDGKARVEVPAGASVSMQVDPAGNVKVKYHRTHLQLFLQIVDYLLRLIGVRKTI